MTESEILNTPTFLQYTDKNGNVVQEPYPKETIYDRMVALENKGCHNFYRVIGGGSSSILIQISKSSKEVERTKTFVTT